MANGARRTGEATVREREMRRLVAAGERDGLTVRECAARAGMAAGTLAWWRSEIVRRDAQRTKRDSEPEFIEVVAAPERATEPSVGLVTGEDGESLPAFELELRGGRRLRVAAGYGLARLVREIEGC